MAYSCRPDPSVVLVLESLRGYSLPSPSVALVALSPSVALDLADPSVVLDENLERSLVDLSRRFLRIRRLVAPILPGFVCVRASLSIVPLVECRLVAETLCLLILSL